MTNFEELVDIGTQAIMKLPTHHGQYTPQWLAATVAKEIEPIVRADERERTPVLYERDLTDRDLGWQEGYEAAMSHAPAELCDRIFAKREYALRERIAQALHIAGYGGQAVAIVRYGGQAKVVSDE
jgi:hypothetical protein